MIKHIKTDQFNKTEALHFIISYLESLSTVAKASGLQELSDVLSKLQNTILEKEGEEIKDYAEVIELIDFYKNS